MNRFTFVDCKTVPEALDQMGRDTAVKAGGIDLLDLMKEGISTPSKIVNIRNVTALRGITTNGEGLRIGPLATLEELSSHGAIRAQYAALADAAGHAATPQVRNMATLGGNLMQRPRCWYFRSEDFDCRKK
ncbi:MAG: FAD binding domain-containing protein, partial [Acidobacteriaceae bacterium]|nr:FAD binding domain-containing protein [Acidobacteriaceae bacterium]